MELAPSDADSTAELHCVVIIEAELEAQVFGSFVVPENLYWSVTDVDRCLCLSASSLAEVGQDVRFVWVELESVALGEVVEVSKHVS